MGLGKKKKAEDAPAIKTKDEVAREKVEALLSDVPAVLAKKSDVAPATEPDAIVSRDDKKSKSWLEDQLGALTERNEELEAQLAAAKEDFKRLAADFTEHRKRAGLPPSDTELTVKIISLFKKFERQYLGQNPERTRYTTIKFSNPPNNNGVLEEFIKTFGDLLKKK